ncbi:MAG: 2-keto-4-pentenoate hydratase [Planctomycetaceae bacterium]
MNTTSPPDIDGLAERVLADYDRHDPSTVFADGLRLSIEEGQRLQDAVAHKRERRGERVVGYKIGCIFKGNQQLLGVTHPVSGRLWSTEQHADGARLARANFANVAIEGEFAVTLSRDVPRDASLAVIAEAVEQVFPVIELHNLRLLGVEPRGAELIANNAIHCGVVRGVGSPRPVANVATDLSIRFDGQVVDRWTDIRWPEGILQTVGWLADRLANLNQQLTRGQTILTGALGPPLPVAHVGHVQVESSQFGAVEAWFE